MPLCVWIGNCLTYSIISWFSVWFRFVYDEIAAEHGIAKSGGGELAGGSSEKRRYFASIFQQVGVLTDQLGGGSMSLLCRVNQERSNASLNPGVDAGGVEYTLTDFRNENSSPQILFRIEALMEKGVKISGEVLEKLKIPLPDRSLRQSAAQTFALGKNEFVNDMKSHTDGHVVFENRDCAINSKEFNTTLHSPGLVPNLSLSRVTGGGDSKGTASDNDSLSVSGLTSRLRGELSQVNDLRLADQTEGMESRHRLALSWLCALEQNVSDGPLAQHQQILLLYYAHCGFYHELLDGVISPRGGDDSAINWSEVKISLFDKHDIAALNRLLISQGEENARKLLLGIGYSEKLSVESLKQLELSLTNYPQCLWYPTPPSD